MENKDIDKLFRQAFEDAEQEVNPDIWQNIENELDKEVKKTTSILFKAYRRIGYAAAVFIVLGISFFFLKDKPKEQIVAEQLTAGQDDILAQTTPVVAEELISQKDTLADTAVLDKIENAIAVKTSRKTDFNVAKSVPHSQQNNNSAASSVSTENREELPIAVVPDLSIDKGTIQENPAKLSQSDIPTRQVTEIEPIKPLVVFEEEEESMYAANEASANKENTVITTILNKLSENIDLKSKKEVRFKSDDEGSIFINLVNPLAKNPNKKRK